mmetsp:Transcript_17483/g.40118  ORF Transcript_17483/g.40118 Transcript_17483/m.40118 type:complete len:277 (+) Transcript_17483:15-845(+)
MEEGLVTLPQGDRYAWWSKHPTSEIAVVMLHGACARGDQFSDLLSGLQPHCSVATYDRVGCGKSPKPTDWHEYASERMVDEAVSFCKMFGGKRTVLIGHSYGALLAFQVHQRLKEDAAVRVERLVLIGSALNAASGAAMAVFYLPEFLLARMQPAMTDGFIAGAFHPSASPELVERERGLANANPMGMCKAFYRQLRWALQQAAAGGEKVPVLLIHGRADGLTPLSQAEALEAHLTETGWQPQLVCVEEASHQVMQEKPAKVVDLVLGEVLGNEAA